MDSMRREELTLAVRAFAFASGVFGAYDERGAVG